MDLEKRALFEDKKRRGLASSNNLVGLLLQPSLNAVNGGVALLLGISILIAATLSTGGGAHIHGAVVRLGNSMAAAFSGGASKARWHHG